MYLVFYGVLNKWNEMKWLKLVEIWFSLQYACKFAGFSSFFNFQFQFQFIFIMKVHCKNTNIVHTGKPRPEAHIWKWSFLKCFWRASTWFHNNRYYNSTIYIIDNVIVLSNLVESSGYSSKTLQKGSYIVHMLLWTRFYGNLNNMYSKQNGEKSKKGQYYY